MDAAEGIRIGNEKFSQAVRQRDSAIMPSLFTSDAKILPPNGEAVSGRDAITAFWQAFFELGIAEALPVTHEVIQLGDFALEVGDYTALDKDQKLVDRGKIMVLWKNEDGVWKYHRDTWNSSLPPPAP